MGNVAGVGTSFERREKSGSPPYEGGVDAASADGVVLSDVHVSAGGVGPIPFYLKETSAFLTGKTVTEETITAAQKV